MKRRKPGEPLSLADLDHIEIILVATLAAPVGLLGNPVFIRDLLDAVRELKAIRSNPDFPNPRPG